MSQLPVGILSYQSETIFRSGPNKSGGRDGRRKWDRGNELPCSEYVPSLDKRLVLMDMNVSESVYSCCCGKQ